MFDYNLKKIKDSMVWMYNELSQYLENGNKGIIRNLVMYLEHEWKTLGITYYKLWFYDAKKDFWCGGIGSMDKEGLEGYTLKYFGKEYDKYIIIPENLEIPYGINMEIMKFMLNIYNTERKEKLVIKDI